MDSDQVGVCWEEFIVALLNTIGNYDNIDGLAVKIGFALCTTLLFLYVQHVTDRRSRGRTQSESSAGVKCVQFIYEFCSAIERRREATFHQVLSTNMNPVAMRTQGRA